MRVPVRRWLVAAAAAWVVAATGPAAFAQEAGDTARLGVSAGYVLLQLPDISFTTRVSEPDARAVSTQVDHDGRLAGTGLSFVLEGPADSPHVNVRGSLLMAGSTQTVTCIPGATACYWPVIVDDPGRADGIYSPFASEPVRNVTSRTARAAGLAVELAGPAAPFGFTGGLDLRGMGVDTSIEGICVGCTPDGVALNYSERLETLYLGLYAGLAGEVALGEDLALGFDGRLGVYAARARFSAHEVQIYPGYPDDLYDLALERFAPALIGSAEISLKKRIGQLDVALFSRAEFNSWSPHMRYNNADDAPSTPWAGTQLGTVIGDGRAWSATFGLSASMGF